MPLILFLSGVTVKPMAVILMRVKFNGSQPCIQLKVKRNANQPRFITSETFSTTASSLRLFYHYSCLQIPCMVPNNLDLFNFLMYFYNMFGMMIIYDGLTEKISPPQNDKSKFEFLLKKLFTFNVQECLI